MKLCRFFYFDVHCLLQERQAESKTYTGPTLIVTRKNNPHDYLPGSPLKDGDSPTMTAQSQPRQVFTLTTTRVS